MCSGGRSGAARTSAENRVRTPLAGSQNKRTLRGLRTYSLFTFDLQLQLHRASRKADAISPGRPQFGTHYGVEYFKDRPHFVGNFPSTDGACEHSAPGSILLINSQGKQIASLANTQFINGPWDSALFEGSGWSKLFVSNALSGTVSRLDFDIDNGQPRLVDAVQIASGYQHRCDPVTFVVGPTGLVYDAGTDTLFVASTGENVVFAVHYAGTTSHDQGKGEIIYEGNTHLHGALAMEEAPNGHLLVTNSDGINPDPNQPSEIVEFTKDGKFVAQLSVDPAQGGAFGLGFGNPKNGAVRFAAVDDNASTLIIWKLFFSRY
jgi:hypothetical protein